MKFAISRIWREPRDHLEGCYFCMIDVSTWRKDRTTDKHPNIPSSIAPVPHSDSLPAPVPEMDPTVSSSPSSSSLASAEYDEKIDPQYGDK